MCNINGILGLFDLHVCVCLFACIYVCVCVYVCVSVCVNGCVALIACLEGWSRIVIK